MNARSMNLLGCAFLLGAAIQKNNGALDHGAAGLLALSVMIALWTTLRRTREDVVPGFTAWLMIGLQLGTIYLDPPGIYMQVQGVALFNLGLAVVALGIVLGARKPQLPALFVLLGGFAMLQVWLILTSPAPHIDVWAMQQNAAWDLLHGNNPYAARWPSVYTPVEDASWYGPGLAEGGRLNFGFPYPPLSLLLSLPGYLVGDVRFSHAIAQLAAAFLIATIPHFGVSPRSFAAAALFLLTPRGLFVLEQSWTEPFAVLLFALVAWSANRSPRAWPAALAALLSVKQSLLILAPLAWADRLERRHAYAFAGVGLLTLPFVLWSPADFWTSVVMVHALTPWRPESLTLPNYFAVQAPQWVAAAIALLYGGVKLRQISRGPWNWGSTEAAAAVVLLLFFAFSPTAWANYYYLVIGALCVGAAVE